MTFMMSGLAHEYAIIVTFHSYEIFLTCMFCLQLPYIVIEKLLIRKLRLKNSELAICWRIFNIIFFSQAVFYMFYFDKNYSKMSRLPLDK